MPDQDPRGDAIRVHIDRTQPLPDPARYLHPPCFDSDDNPVYFASATLGADAVQPCKATLKVDELVCSVPQRLVARVHRGAFTVLPLTEAMELVPTSHGRVPAGCRPVVGGVDERGRLLYHAIAWVRGERVPGRTSEHLGAAAVLLDGREHYVYDAHEILCWRDDADDHHVGRAPAVNDAPERATPNNDDDIDIDSDSGRSVALESESGQARPGDRDAAGMHLRVTVSDLATVTPYPAATDFDGTTPLYFGSAVLDAAIFPGKVVEMRTCHVLRGDAVVECTTGFSVLPFSDDMELVPTARGAVPRGRRPVGGNYDEQGRRLYHAMLHVVGRQFPGMCAEHVGGAQGVLQGKKHTMETGYAILCWKENADAGSEPPQHVSYRVDPAGQWLRKPLNANEPLTTAVLAQGFGEPYHPECPYFFASALHDGHVTPCCVYADQDSCTFAYDDVAVISCTGPYCILPYLPDRMERVWATNGDVPAGRTPVEGGRDREGRVLYHALGCVADGGQWPMMGMAAKHLGGAIIVCQVGGVHRLPSGYQLLCWKT